MEMCEAVRRYKKRNIQRGEFLTGNGQGKKYNKQTNKHKMLKVTPARNPSLSPLQQI